MNNKLSTGLILIMLTLTGGASAATFSETIGTHGEIQDWTSSVRSPGNVSDTINSNLSYADNLSAFQATTKNIGNYSTVVLQVFGGREESNVKRFLGAVRADKGVGLSQHMAAKSNLTANRPNVFWQIGNEINNKRLSDSIHAWLGDGIIGKSNDLSIISTYVEMWFAPSAEGIRKNNGKIILGSVASASNPQAVLFINTLLRYKIVGTFAPSLTGKTVAELIDIGSIHYSMGSDNYTDPLLAFSNINKLVWTTEEVGYGSAIAEVGMPQALRSIGRAFDWWLDNATTGKVFLWGAGFGVYNINDLMPLVTTHIGESTLSKYYGITVQGEGIESHTFAAVEAGKRVLFINTALSNGTGRITGIVGATVGTLTVFRETGATTTTLTPDLTGYVGLNIPLDGKSAAFVQMLAQ